MRYFFLFSSFIHVTNHPDNVCPLTHSSSIPLSYYHTHHLASLLLLLSLTLKEHFIGFGLDSTEQGNPAFKFAKAFAKVRELGFHVVAHAGKSSKGQGERDEMDEMK